LVELALAFPSAFPKAVFDKFETRNAEAKDAPKDWKDIF